VYAHPQCVRNKLINEYYLRKARDLRFHDLPGLPTVTLVGFSEADKEQFEYQAAWNDDDGLVPSRWTIAWQLRNHGFVAVSDEWNDKVKKAHQEVDDAMHTLGDSTLGKRKRQEAQREYGKRRRMLLKTLKEREDLFERDIRAHMVDLGVSDGDTPRLMEMLKNGKSTRDFFTWQGCDNEYDDVLQRLKNKITGVVSKERRVREITERLGVERVNFLRQSHNLRRYKCVFHETSDIEFSVDDVVAAVTEEFDKSPLITRTRCGPGQRQCTGRGCRATGSPNCIVLACRRCCRNPECTRHSNG
jgi:hypothetical protein